MLALYVDPVYAEPVRTIGENIKAARKAAGIKTQGELAKRIGVPQPQMSDWENNRYKAPDTTNLLKIAAGLGCQVADLVRGTKAHARYDSLLVSVDELAGSGATRELPVRLSVPLWLELTEAWDLMTTANHHALLVVARSFLKLEPPGEVEMAGPQKAGPIARRPR